MADLRQGAKQAGPKEFTRWALFGQRFLLRRSSNRQRLQLRFVDEPEPRILKIGAIEYLSICNVVAEHRFCIQVSVRKKATRR